MNFELLPLTLAKAASAPADGLMVFVPESFEAGDDAISRHIADARSGGDLELAAGKLLQAWRVKGVQALRVLLVGLGDASPAQTRKAVTSAMAAVRGTPVRTLTLCFAGGVTGASLRAAVLAAADATYAYTLTKSKPDASKLERVTLGVADVATVQSGFDQGVGMALGV